LSSISSFKTEYSVLIINHLSLILSFTAPVFLYISPLSQPPTRGPTRQPCPSISPQFPPTPPPRSPAPPPFSPLCSTAPAPAHVESRRRRATDPVPAGVEASTEEPRPAAGVEVRGEEGDEERGGEGDEERGGRGGARPRSSAGLEGRDLAPRRARRAWRGTTSLLGRRGVPCSTNRASARTTTGSRSASSATPPPAPAEQDMEASVNRCARTCRPWWRRRDVRLVLPCSCGCAGGACPPSSHRGRRRRCGAPLPPSKVRAGGGLPPSLPPSLPRARAAAEATPPRGAREVVGWARQQHVVGSAEDGGASSIPLDTKEIGLNAFLASSSSTPAAAGKTAFVSSRRRMPVPGADGLRVELCHHSTRIGE
jgi:hypothetical protein